MKRTQYVIMCDSYYKDGVRPSELKTLTNSFVFNHEGDHFGEDIESYDTFEEALKNLPESTIDVCNSYYHDHRYHVVMNAYTIEEVVEEFDEDTNTWDTVDFVNILAESKFDNPYSKEESRNLCYVIEDNTGIVIEEVRTLEKAKELMKKFVEQDEANGYTDTDSWYEIYELDYDDCDYREFVEMSK